MNVKRRVNLERSVIERNNVGGEGEWSVVRRTANKKIRQRSERTVVKW